jgi:hypothetical protein
MKITILGAKNIGGTLGRAWAAAGHQVRFGVRTVANPDVQALVQELGETASVTSVADAIQSGEAVVFAIPGQAMEATIAEHASALAGKIVIDAANNIGAPTMNSLAAFAAHVPTAQVFRAFNSLGWENFAHPRFGDIQADLFFSGPAGRAQAQVEQLIADVGLRPVWVGGPEQTPLVDAIGGLWFVLALGQGRGRHLAFKLLTDEA